jgi:uncharacterized protein with PIN domain
MSEAIDIYVLDTSAWLTLIEDEAGADSVQELLVRARVNEVVVLVSFMSFMEVYYITLQERDPVEAQTRVELMAARNATLVHKDPEFEQVESAIKVLKLPYKARA